MAIPLTLARLEVTNAQGFFDSQSPIPSRGDGLDTPKITATVTKTLDPTPNTAEITITNLSQQTVNLITGTVVKRIEYSPIEQAQLLALGASAAPIEIVYDNFGLGSVRLSWGYPATDPLSPTPPLSVGFIGGSSSMRSTSNGLETVLTIKAEDGGQLLGAGRLVKSYKRNTSTVDIMVDLINACGLNVDRTRLEAAMLTALSFRGIIVTDLNQKTGYNAATAPAATQITTVMESLGVRWSIQDGQFLLLDSNSVLAGYPPIILAEELGTLFGTPEPLEAQQMIARTWANPEARPGRQVEISSAALGTQYRIDTAVTTIDTYSGGESRLTLDAIQVIPGVF